MAIYSVGLSPLAGQFIENLDDELRLEFYRAASFLSASPSADGVVKVKLPFPYASGVLGAEVGRFWFIYRLIGRRMEIATIDFPLELDDI